MTKYAHGNWPRMAYYYVGREHNQEAIECDLFEALTTMGCRNPVRAINTAVRLGYLKRCCSLCSLINSPPKQRMTMIALGSIEPPLAIHDFRKYRRD